MPSNKKYSSYDQDYDQDYNQDYEGYENVYEDEVYEEYQNDEVYEPVKQNYLEVEYIPENEAK